MQLMIKPEVCEMSLLRITPLIPNVPINAKSEIMNTIPGIFER